METLNNEDLIHLYGQAIQFDLDLDFINLLLNEINRRDLKVIVKGVSDEKIG